MKKFFGYTIDFKILIFGLIKKFNEDEIFALASQLAYSLVLSFFPFLIFLLTIIGFLSLDSAQVLIALEAFLPNNVYELISSIVLDIVESQNGSLLSFSLILSIWSASTGFGAVIKGLNKAYDEQENRGFIRVKLISILFTVSIVAIIIVNLILLVFGNVIGGLLLKYEYVSKDVIIWVWGFLKYVIIIFTTNFLFAVLYRYTPARRLTWKEVIPGAVFTTVNWIIVSLGFSYYVNNFNNFSRFYGSIGAVIVLMIWVFLSSIIILLGGEINALIALMEKKRRLT
ncbi:YihY/virulence factor BrkB family protein [Clostridium amazonitimonense]|uniref:YihY/virulence factor BrkB family protein n=1 Tax=Clostridium amazonitimonense TaxID=1499689 RepID=UPI000509A1E5|nr:YihY/virulence factor BrkB family protein [Clostridium amazonitimonense]